MGGLEHPRRVTARLAAELVPAQRERRATEVVAVDPHEAAQSAGRELAGRLVARRPTRTAARRLPLHLGMGGCGRRGGDPEREDREEREEGEGPHERATREPKLGQSMASRRARDVVRQGLVLWHAEIMGRLAHRGHKREKTRRQLHVGLDRARRVWLWIACSSRSSFPSDQGLDGPASIGSRRGSCSRGPCHRRGLRRGQRGEGARRQAGPRHPRRPAQLPHVPPAPYQVATAGLEPADVAYPIRTIFGKDANISFRHGTVVDSIPMRAPRC